MGAPDIVIADKGPRCAGAQGQQFYRDRNITLQTVVPGNHQSLGGAGRHMYFRDITHRIKDGGGRVENIDWREYASMRIRHLNSQLQQYGG